MFFRMYRLKSEFFFVVFEIQTTDLHILCIILLIELSLWGIEIEVLIKFMHSKSTFKLNHICQI